MSFESLKELDIDIRSVHGMVKLTPIVESEPDFDLTKYIRVVESEDGYKSVVTDNDGNIIYDMLLDNNGGLPWSEFLSGNSEFMIEAVADNGYCVSSYRVVRSSTDEESVTDFESGVYTSYSWNVNLPYDRIVIVDFSEEGQLDISEGFSCFDDNLNSPSDILGSFESDILSDDSDDHNT